MLHGERILFVSGTVEILFRTHTDASRGVPSTFYPEGMRIDRIWRLPISGQSLRKAFLSALVAQAKRVVEMTSEVDSARFGMGGVLWK